MIIIGVTGNSGSGKSTVSTIIKNNTGAFVINADEVANNLRDEQTEYYNKIVELFGEEILSKKQKSAGKIDKAALANAIFNDDKKREALNKLTFRYVGMETKKIILDNKDSEFIVLDFPLLYEGGFDKICNYVIAVTSDEKAKIDRIKERDRVKEFQAQRRLDSQKTDEEFKSLANYTIENLSTNRYLNLVKDTIRVIHKIKAEEEKKKKGVV